MTDFETVLADAGLVVLVEVGTPEDVGSVWRAFIVSTAVPSVHVPTTEDDSDLDALELAWASLAARLGLVSRTGEFLLSVAGPGSATRPWTRVRANGAVALRDLSVDYGIVELVASDLERTISLGVGTGEDEYCIFVSRTDPATGLTPVAAGKR